MPPPAVGGGSAPPSPAPIRVLTYNVKAAQGSMGGNAREVILRDLGRQIRESGADVVVLQEIDRGTARSGRVDQLAELSRLTGATDSAFVGAFNFQGGEYGQAILTRNGVTIDDEAGQNRVGRIDLGTGGPRPHIALAAPIRTADGREMTVLGTHLSSGPQAASERAAQMQALGALVERVRSSSAMLGARALPASVLLAGDFNTSAAEVDRDLRPASLGLQDAFSAVGVGFGAKARVSHVGGRDLDHLLVDNTMQVLASWTMRGKRHTPDPSLPAWRGVWELLFGERLSDHYGVVSDIQPL